MKIMTINNPGREFEVLGLLQANSTRGASALKDNLARVKDFFGGRSKSYSNMMKLLVEDIYADLEKQARAGGADAVVGLRIQLAPVGRSKMMAIHGVGTAIKYRNPE